MRRIFAFSLLLGLTASCGHAAVKIIQRHSTSPLVSIRVTFLTGAAEDPPGKEGVAALTAAMLARGGTKTMSYREILDALFPMATTVQDQTDKEMITFSAVTHRDNLEAFYKIFRSMILEPGWRVEDFNRLRDEHVNFLRVTLRQNNDEELGKEVLYLELYRNHPYGHHNLGTVSSLKQLSLKDVQEFYQRHFTRSNVIVGVAGNYDEKFVQQLQKDFEKLPAGSANKEQIPPAPFLKANRLTIVQKETPAVAISIGFPIAVKRGHPDYPALLLATSYFGQHRMSGGRLYERMRRLRGLNYGDYAYIEYFPNGMFQLEPDPNLARSQQIFQIWIRPVEPQNAVFALRLAMYELHKLINEGIPEEAFERTRKFLSRYVNLLLKTRSVELGYATDSLFYGIPDYSAYVSNALAKLTRQQVNEAIRRHLRTEPVQIVMVAQDAESIKKTLLANAPSPIKYNSPKPPEILEEDKIVERWPIPMEAESVRVIPVEEVFE